jgi:hypothetical protein
MRSASGPQRNQRRQGHVNTINDPAGATTTNNLGPAGRATAISYSDGVTLNVTAIGYDPDGRRTAPSSEPSWVRHGRRHRHHYLDL